jgi:hypothetical protein
VTLTTSQFVRRLGSVLWILHPFLFFFYSTFSLIVANPSFAPQAMIRSIVIGFSTLFLILTYSHFRWNGERAALILSGVIILFFAYGHLVNLIETYFGQSFPMIGEWVLLIPILAAALLWIYFVGRRLHQASTFTQYFLVVGILVNLFPLLQQLRSARFENIVQAQFHTYQDEMKAQLNLEKEGSEEKHTADKVQRDIYYIVLDAYARADVLKDLYGYDNSAFLDFLEMRGFYIASESHTNYISTEFSLASTLNMSHISDLPEILEEHGGADENSVKELAGNLIASSIIQEYLQERGYTIVAFESGYDSTALRDENVYMQSPDLDRGSLWRVGFEVMLLDSSLGRLVMRAFPESADTLDWLFDLHRGRILYTLDHLPDFVQDERPTFVYAHIISPHTPYVFGPNGERIEHQNPFTLLDADPGNPENIQLYRDQVHFLNSLVMDVIEEILQNSPTKPIIILQADHGSKVYRDKEPSPEIQCRLNLPILNAYYFPDDDAEKYLYPSISPVNSFRAMLNGYFYEDLGTLEDESFVLIQKEGSMKFESYQKAVAPCP